MLEMPVLQTARLLIRPFVMEDLADAHRLFDIELLEAALHTDKMESLEERKEWLQWAARNHHQLAILYQPPYGDRAVILKATGELIGSAGLVPCLAPFEQLPGFSQSHPASLRREDFDDPSSKQLFAASQSSPAYRLMRSTAEVGLFYAISPSRRNHGYAHEAAQALVNYAFQHLNLKRIVATTDYDNLASIGVMRKLGMRIERNPFKEPSWLQVVGMLENAI